MAHSFHGEVTGPALRDEDSPSPWTDYRGPCHMADAQETTEPKSTVLEPPRNPKQDFDHFRNLSTRCFSRPHLLVAVALPETLRELVALYRELLQLTSSYSKNCCAFLNNARFTRISDETSSKDTEIIFLERNPRNPANQAKSLIDDNKTTQGKESSCNRLRPGKNEHRGIAVYSKSLIRCLQGAGAEAWLLTEYFDKSSKKELKNLPKCTQKLIHNSRILDSVPWENRSANGSI